MSILAGKIEFVIDGELQQAKGTFTYNLGRPKRETIFGADLNPLGAKEVSQEPFIEGNIQDMTQTDLSRIVTMDGVTVTLNLTNGKIISLKDAWYAGEANVTTEEASIPVRFVGKSAEEIV